MDPDTKYSSLIDTQRISKVAMSLHLHHVPQADMLECSLEILLNNPNLKTCTFEYAAPQMGFSTMMYWQMTHVWWLL
jgi:hypothetical protein